MSESESKTRRGRAAAGAVAVVFPVHGCEPVGVMDERGAADAMRARREMIRQGWTQPGVKALVEMIEMRCAMLGKAAVAPGAGAHEQGQAFAMQELLGVITQIRLTGEQ